MRATSPCLLLVWSIGGAGLCGCDPPFPVQPTGAVHAAAPVQILTEPEAGAPAVLDLISSAHASLWMEMYLLTDGPAIAALVGRAAAGCDVRVILEPAPYEDAGANQPAFDQLAAAGVDVRWSTARFTYTHAKTFGVDHARLVVLTLNLTAAGLSGNREYVALDDDPTDVAAAEAMFVADQQGAVTGVPGGRLVTSPESSRPTALALIAGAETSLALETEELTDGQIVGALVAALGRGVAVTLVWPGPASDGGAPFTALTGAGAVVRSATAPPIHGKVIVVDDRALYVGSANLTPTSLDDNREIGLLLNQSATAAAVGGTVAADAAGGS
ncbi:MAG TPA: phospholipase D-like domain-containing protein [Polyangia bacterium]|nr:phospholipase D-like domain-containing protein [Polyangia bacterium]